MHNLLFIGDLPTQTAVLLVIAILGVCIFEAINGFHDTANAVATVIYTKSLKPNQAVIWSGIMNFCGVYFGGIAVAMSVIKLIPLTELITTPLGENMALVFSILLAAIIWNLGTWYFGIPCSSSHTLIGALLGGGFGFYIIHGGAGPNWDKAQSIGWALLVSPLFGFGLAVLLMFFLRAFMKKRKELFTEPEPGATPPLWIRAILIGTCTLVSFFHGSNDGQKGIGLMMVALMCILPMKFALNSEINLQEHITTIKHISTELREAATSDRLHSDALVGFANQSDSLVYRLTNLNVTDKSGIFEARSLLIKYNKALDGAIGGELITGAASKSVKSELKELKGAYEFAPLWVKIIISLCLGIGTMIGWKRIVVTIGEKIGKSHLTYAQGASAELCAAATIAASTGMGLPVSTTHVLSSAIAGTMVASGGVKNLQKKTILNIALAWVLTLPVTMALAAGLFFVLRLVL